MRLGYHEPEDELDGIWTREQLLEMNALFAAALEKAFELGLETRLRRKARSEVRLR